MKKIISLLILFIAFSSCQEEVKQNNPSVQAQKDNAFWRATDSRATVNADGSLTISAYTDHEIVTLKTSSANTGTYYLGTTNQSSKATYTSNFENVNTDYETKVFLGPASKLNLPYLYDNLNKYYYYSLNGGSGYTEQSSAVTTTTGSGFGLKVKTNVTNGVITRVRISSPGNNYLPGDLITISGGTTNATFKILNTQNSNGEVIITSFDGATVSGTFAFNAVSSDSSLGNISILNYQFGTFYKVPIVPMP